MRTVCHITTAHQANDVRIFERECRSLTQLPDTRVVLVASGTTPLPSRVQHVRLNDIPTNRYRRFAAAPLRAITSARKVPADVYHFHDPEALPAALYLAQRGRTVVWDAHEDYVEQISTGGKEWLPGFAQGAVRRGTTRVLKEVDRQVAAVIAATPTILSRYSNPRTILVGNEARLEEFSSVVPSLASRRLLFTGQVSEAHCFTQVVEAVAEVPDVTLGVARAVPESAEWRRAREVLGPRLEQLGWLGRAELATAMSESAIGLVTYADVRTNTVNSPNKVFEFAAGGLPVLCTPNPSLAGMVTRAGVGIAASDFTAAALAAGIRQLLDNEDEWNRMSAAARRFAAEHGSWSASEERLLDLYEELLPARTDADDSDR